MSKLLTRAVGSLSTGAVLVTALATPALAAPNPKPNLPSDVEGKLNTILGMGMAVVIIACVAGVFLVAGKMALALHRGEGGEAVKGLGLVGAACVLVGSAAGIVNYLV